MNGIESGSTPNADQINIYQKMVAQKLKDFQSSLQLVTNDQDHGLLHARLFGGAIVSMSSMLKPELIDDFLEYGAKTQLQDIQQILGPNHAAVQILMEMLGTVKSIKIFKDGQVK